MMLLCQSFLIERSSILYRQSIYINIIYLYINNYKILISNFKTFDRKQFHYYFDEKYNLFTNLNKNFIFNLYMRI